MEKRTEHEQREQSSFQADIAMLRHVSLFRGLGADCLKLLAMLSKRIDYVVGDRLMTQGEDDGCAFYIVAGKVTALHQHNSRTQVLRTYEAGEFIGGLGLFGTMVRLYTLEIIEETTVLRVRRSELKKVIERHPDCLSQMVHNIAREINSFDEALLARAPLEDGAPDVFSGLSLL